MRKTLFAVIVGLICFSFVATAMAGPGLKPRADGNDIIVPDMVIKAIPDFSSSSEVYAACDLNGWLQNTEEIPVQILKSTQMEKTEDGWVAKDMKGEVFHPTQIQDGEPVPAKLEDVYVHIKEFDFIDWSGKGPSILVE